MHDKNTVFFNYYTFPLINRKNEKILLIDKKKIRSYKHFTYYEFQMYVGIAFI